MGEKRSKGTENQKKKARKVTSGLLRDKARTKARMIAAVGKVLQKKGYTGLTAPNVAKEAGVDKKLVWTYFGGLDNLAETYIAQRDFWKQGAKSQIKTLEETPEDIGREDINGLLQNQLDTLLKDKILQRIIHWELGEKNEMLRRLSDERDALGERIFEIIEPEFKKKDVEIRAVLAILIGGIYYLSLHGKVNGSLFCGIDINEEKGKQQISKAIKDILYNTFDFAGVDK